MTVRAHRRLRLPADDRTPAVARAAVRQVLLAGGRTDQLDEALLLVSELSTNGIVHAGTPVDVDVVADDTGVTITVSDQRSGLVGAGNGASSRPFALIAAGGGDGAGALEERGRGLMLVDRLASSWGTSHHATGKSVWFRLGADTVPDTGPPRALDPPEASARSAHARDPERTTALVQAERVRIAAELQQAVRPRPLPAPPGIEFGAVHVPAGTGDVGGDFYDVFPVRPNRWFVAMGDIGGKGSRAVVMTGAVREVMRALIGEDRATPNMLATLNRTVLADADDRYATIAAATVTRLQPPGRPRVLDVALCLAGHDRPVLLRSDGSARSVGECGTAVGLVEEFATPEVHLTLHQGDALVFVTDGVTERRAQSSRYGNGRLRDLLGTLAGLPAPEIADRVRQDVLAFAAEPPRDDIAVLVLRNRA